MDQINESVDILVQYRDDDHSDHVQMIKLPQLNFISTRPLYAIQERNILSIGEYFKDKNWLLLPTFTTMNTMYLCNKIEFEQKVSEHFIQTKAYTLIKECSDMNPDDLQYFFNHLNREIDWKLTDLFFRRRLSMEQYIQMMSTNKRDENPINSMIFLPDTRMDMVPFQPKMLNASGPIIYISQYLHQYLRLSYCLVAHSTTFTNGIDVVQALEKFTKEGFLKHITQFVTLEIKDFDIIFSHEQIIETLTCFLHDYIPHQSRTTSYLSHKTIIILVRLVLKMQYFMYDNKLYQQTKGGNSDSSLIQLLVNIYLFYWQQDLMQFLRRKKELFGRCYNKMFLTWNGSKRQFHSHFHGIKTKLSDLPIELSIGKTIHYLDVEILQNNGILRTKVYRSGLIERYTLPYLTNYPLDQYATRIRRHLIRTIQLCINIQDFRNEHLFIYTIYLLNGFPLDFVDHCVHEFFHEFNPSKLNYRYDQKAYESLRRFVITNSQVSDLPMHNNKRPNHNDLDTETSMKRIKTE